MGWLQDLVVICIVVLVLFAFIRKLLHRDAIDKLPTPPRDHWLLGHSLLLNQMPFYMPKWAQEFGALFLLHLGPHKFVFVSDPAVARDVFLQSSQRLTVTNSYNLFTTKSLFDLNPESEWRAERRRLNPLFSTNKITAMIPMMVECTQRVIDQLRNSAGEYVNISRLMRVLVMDIFMGVTFSVKFDLKNAEDAALLDALEHVNETYLIGNLLYLLPVIGGFIPHPFVSRLKAASKFMRAYSERLMENRRDQMRQGLTAPLDFLTELINASSTSLDAPLPATAKRNIVDEIMFFFFAGHEASTTAHLWTLFELCRHPDIYARVAEEADQTVDLDDSTIPVDAFLSSLSYSDQVYKEVLRRYPVTSITFRMLHEKMQVGQYTIPENTQMAINIIGLHRLPSSWSHPNEFYPEHFSKEESAHRDSGSYFPFGGGARACIGMKMAQVEQKLVLTYLLKHFDFHLKPSQDIKAVSGLTLHPSADIFMSFTPRSVK